MLIIAATALEKMKDLPPSFWLKILIGIAVVVGVVIGLRKLAGMNKVVLAVIVFLGLGFLGFSWIYNRNEPAFLTPIVERIAPFFPSKDSYSGKQQGSPKM